MIEYKLYNNDIAIRHNYGQKLNDKIEALIVSAFLFDFTVTSWCTEKGESETGKICAISFKEGRSKLPIFSLMFEVDDDYQVTEFIVYDNLDECVVKRNQFQFCFEQFGEGRWLKNV